MPKRRDKSPWQPGTASGSPDKDRDIAAEGNEGGCGAFFSGVAGFLRDDMLRRLCLDEIWSSRQARGYEDN